MERRGKVGQGQDRKQKASIRGRVVIINLAGAEARVGMLLLHGSQNASRKQLPVFTPRLLLLGILESTKANGVGCRPGTTWKQPPGTTRKALQLSFEQGVTNFHMRESRIQHFILRQARGTWLRMGIQLSAPKGLKSQTEIDTNGDNRGRG